MQTNITSLKSGFIYGLIYAISSLAISYLLFGDILFALNDFQLDRSGDGFKNYFSFAYHYRFGSGLWFEGMQYPYGDLVSYADGQPAVVMLFKILKALGLDLTGKELFLVQALPVLGLFLASLILHQIYREFKINGVWIAISVVACLALSPQLFRFNSHYALAYCFCFPAILLLSIRWINSRITSRVFIISVSLLALIFAFIHPYHLLIASVFLLALALVYSIQKKSIAWPLIIAALAPMIIYMIINSGLDPYADRTQNPYGQLAYTTELSDLLPFYGWQKIFIGIVPGLNSNFSEGYCYPGWLLILSPIILYFAYAKRSRISIDNTIIKIGLASLLCLLFATGIHLYIGDQVILEILSPLKQFRALGRFSWPFYYIAFISLSIITYQLCVKNLSKRYATAILAIVCILWLNDIYAYTKSFNTHIQRYTDKNLLLSDTELQEIIESSSYTVEDFQAILPIPVPVEGAEKFHPVDNWAAKMKAMPLAYQTSLPMVGCYMSRTSLSRILKQHQLGSSLYMKKEILQDLPNQKDFLTLIHKKDSLLFKDLMQISDPISETKDLFVRALSIDSLSNLKNLAFDEDSIRSKAIYYSDFPEGKEPGLLSDTGLRINESYTLYEGPIDSSYTEIMMSLWFRLESDDTSPPYFSLYAYDENDERILESDFAHSVAERFEVYGNWVQFKSSMDLDPRARKIIWTIKVLDELTIDHLVISSDSNVFFQRLQNDFYIYDHYLVQKDQKLQ